jgi:hypothetical protein
MELDPKNETGNRLVSYPTVKSLQTPHDETSVVAHQIEPLMVWKRKLIDLLVPSSSVPFLSLVFL